MILTNVFQAGSRFVWCCAVVVVCAWTAWGHAAEPVFSKSPKFRIPFQFDASELKRLGADEIQLYVSTNQGASWSLTDSVPPTSDRFTFEAPVDGEYWFSVRTHTKAGATYPDGPHQAGLTVIVDSVAPSINLNLQQAEPGRARLTWGVQELHPALDTLKVEYMHNGTWNVLDVPHVTQGETTWELPAPGEVRVRVDLADRAGNQVQELASTNVSGGKDPNAIPNFNRPVANRGMSITPPGEATKAKTANTSFAANKPEAEPALSDVSPPQKVNSPIPALPPATDLTPIPTVPATTAVVDVPAEPERKLSPAEIVAAAAKKYNAPPIDRPTPPNSSMVQSNSFLINYELDNLGPSGVSSVELYITEDGGRSWFHFGQDPDRQSPMEVKVPYDGDYGFAFRIRNGVGVIGIPPQPGQRPEVNVTVDRVPPMAQLNPVQTGSGDRDVVLSWLAQDRKFAEKSIRMFYAPEASGPWKQIDECTSNTGRFAWSVPGDITKMLHLRMEVEDAAGNVTKVDCPEPYKVDRNAPSARVTEIRPLPR